jgi:hypothetical protein
VPYYYATVRFVPDPARGEYVNLGAIVGDDDSREWAIRHISSLKRARALDERETLPAALEFFGRLEEQLPSEEGEPAHDEMSVERLTALSGEMQNVIQISAPAPLIADTAEAALDMIFEELVVDPASSRFRFEKKHRAVGAVRKAYRAHIPLSAVKERVRLVSGSFHGNFDFAVHNGKAVQLVQCWSFQLPNQEALGEQVKAWAWVVGELRQRGGEVQVDAQQIAVADSLEVASVLIPPAEGKPREAFVEACAAFRELDVSTQEPKDADSLAVRAAVALGR